MSSVTVSTVVTASKQYSDLIGTTLLLFVGLLERTSCVFFLAGLGWGIALYHSIAYVGNNKPHGSEADSSLCSFF